jgi:subtilisin-like proprotein convertase family protein
MRSTRGAALAAVAILLSTMATALAATGHRGPSRLDGRVVHREGGAVAVLPRPLESLESTDALRAGWERFRADHGSAWEIHLDERTGLPSLVSGIGIPWLAGAALADATLDDLERLARSFLADNAALFGDWSTVLELDRAASLRLRDGHWQLVFRQRVDGVAVENARLDLHVVNGRMVLLGAHLWGRPRTGGIPTLDAARALELLTGYLGTDAPALRLAGEPQLTLIAVDAAPSGDDPRPWSGARGAGLRHQLVWRFLLDQADAPIRWVGEVDALDGSIGAFYEGTQYAAVRGGVFPVAPDGDCAQGGCELAGFPMPFADFTVSGQAEQFADRYGNLACSEPDSSVETNLVGPYVRIVDTCGPASEFGTCGGGLDLGLKRGENCSAAPGDSAGNTAAARTSYYHVNRVAEIARFYDPSNAWLRNPLTVNVNLSSSCNANWDRTAINMFGAGGNCNNTGENTDILVHEWGHGYDQNDGGGVDRPSEAYSDVVAILTTRDSCMGRGTYNDGSTCTGYGDTCLTCTGFRDFDWNARQAKTPATPTGFAQPRCPSDTSGFSGPCKREPHCESYVSSEAFYDLATRDLPAAGIDQDSAWQLVDRLWYQTRPGSGGDAYTCLLPLSNSCGATSWYQRMRVADDDDGDLANGTPHAAELFAAFNRHKIACGGANDRTNKNSSNCPALAAPVVTRTMTAAGVELGWAPVTGAAEYRVYRGELGCNRQQVPLVALPSSQTTYVDDSRDSEVLRSYRVQAFGTQRACAGPVSNCVLAPPGSRLQKVSHRVLDDGDGIPEPGETFNLAVSLFNSGADPATSTSGRLTLIAPPEVRILQPAAAWPAIAPGATVESSAPHFQVVVQETARCGDVLTLALSGSASNSSPFEDQVSLPMGNRFVDYPQTDIVPIPSLTASPVETFWNVTEARTVAELDLTLDIFHQDPTQLVVELVSPQGTTVRLHDRTAGNGHGIETRFDRDRLPDGPGRMPDFAGEAMQGVWALRVQDLDGSGVTSEGYIRPRTLHFTIEGAFDCTPQACAQPTPTGAPSLLLARAAGAPPSDLVLNWSAVDGAGYHVLQSTDPAFRNAVELVGTTTTQTTFTLPDGAGTAPRLVYYQVRAVNSCHQEGP